MGDDLHKPALYKWKRQTPTRLYSRSQNVTTKDDIKDWIKKVEDATNKAAEATFGSYHSTGRDKGRYAALQSVQQLHEHDEIQSEAQELLTQWMNEKVRLNDDLDIDEEYWPRRPVQAEVKAEWDHLIADNTDDWEFENSVRSHISRPKDNYFDLEYGDETSAVESVVQSMLQKQVVKDDFLNDLGMDEGKRRKDPRVKMELRHQQVKENREKREQELERRQRALRSKKDANSKAKQIVLKEEQEREITAKHEEMEIKREMARIRKQMQDDRKKMEEDSLRLKKERSDIDNTARSEVQHRMLEENKQQMLKHLECEEKRRTLFKKLEHFQAKQVAKNLRILQQHFSAWYKIVLERRLRLGKARAMSDWKTLLRAWNAWRSYVRSRRVDVETRQYEQSIVDTHRKNRQAQNHYRCTLMRKYLSAWQLYVHQEAERRDMEDAQMKTRNKMMALLDAAATGKLWNDKKTQEESENKDATGRNDASDEDRINELFMEGKRPQSVPLSSRSQSSVGSESRRPSSRLPTEAWQVTKRHINLTSEEIAGLGGGDHHDIVPHSDREVTRRFGKQPWMNSPYIVNNFEHRYSAQQKMLHDQQKQIKDQKRLLEELQYNQRNQLLQKQADLQHVMTEQLARQPLPDNWSPREGAEGQAGHEGYVQKEELSRHSATARSCGSQGLSQRDDLSSSRPSAAGKSNARKQMLAQIKDHDSSRQTAAEQQLNNMFAVHQHQGRIASQQHNEVAKDKETNITLDTSRTESSAVGSRVGFQTARSDFSSRTGAASSASNNKYLKVLRNMEDRAAERAKQKAEREEKRKKAEQEKMEMLLAHEEQLKREAEEEKRARVDAYREKKKMEKQRELEKQQHVERMHHLNQVADAHYLRSILKYRGLLPFKKLVQMSKQAEERADKYHRTCVVRKVFLAWHDHVSLAMKEKCYLADDMYKFLLMKRCLNQWRKYKYSMKIMEEKSKRFYERNILSKILAAWANYAMEEKIASWEKERMAKEHYLMSLQKRMFLAWKRFPDEIRKEEEREKRRIEMRKKVQLLIPDYEGTANKSVDIS